MFLLFSVLSSSVCFLLWFCFLFCVFTFVFNCLILFLGSLVWFFSCFLLSLILYLFLCGVCVSLFLFGFAFTICLGFVCLFLFLLLLLLFVCFCLCYLSLLFVLGFVFLFVFICPHPPFLFPLYCCDVQLVKSWFPGWGLVLSLWAESAESKMLGHQRIPGPREY